MAKKPTSKNKTKPTDPPSPDPDDDEEDQGEEGEEGEEENKRINAIVTQRTKRALKPLVEMIKGLTAKVDSLSQKPAQSSDDDDEEEESEIEKQPRKAKNKSDRELLALSKRVKDAEDRASAAEKAQQEQTEKTRRSEEDSAVQASLTKAGVSDPRVARAIVLSLRSEELISRDDETGKIVFRTVDKYGTETFVDPDSGISKWIKNEGKAFLPAIHAQGSDAPRTLSHSQTPKVDRSKLSPREKASIDLERASQGLPPLE